ncbi:MAG TPA: AMP-binding protein [Polyangiaceae bacterium]|nr:AMP-binding protein [Polyangiaceae bacterium]
MSSLSIFDAAREAPHAVVLIDTDTELTFAEVARRTAPLAGALLRARPTLLALTPRADTGSLLWLYAALATATPVLALHARATEVERRHAMAVAGASPIPESETEGVEGSRGRGVEGHSETELWGSIELPLPPASDGTPLVVIPTSGSSGVPRLVELSRAAWLASARASADNLGWEPDDRWLLCLPLSHTGGLSIVIRCLLARKPVLLFEPGPAGALERLDELQRLLERATLVSLVPSLLSALLDAGWSPAPGLRAVLLGGAACPPALARRAHAAHVPLLTSYGLTETCGQVVTRRYAERLEPLPERDGCASSGHALFGVELTLKDGCIALRGASLLSRFVGEPAPALDADGWLITSDRAELGASGELYVRGRADDVIITGGENVDPLEVEAALLELPGVAAACVFGTESAQFGQVVSAVLVTSRAELASPENLAEQLGDRLARHKLPRRTLCAESLPLTEAGKVDRRACAARWGCLLAGSRR